MKHIRIQALAILLVAIHPAIGQQISERPLASAIDGVVVRLGTGEPLPDVKVELSKTTDGNAYTTTTGADGKFAFENIAPGEYNLLAVGEGGFLQAEYGQRRPTGRGIPLIAEADRRITGIQLSMAATGSISGRIFDQDNEPMSSVSVQALRTTYTALGHQVFSAAQTVQTNDLGEYRLFWLPPGRYYISARPGGSRPFTVPQEADAFTASVAFLTQRTLEDGTFLEEAHLPVYFPGSSDPTSASPIDVAPGGNVSGIDLIVQPPVHARHVRGIVINARTGQPVPDASVTIAPRILSHDMIVSRGRTDENGAFDISGVIPGPHFVFGVVGEDEDIIGSTSIEVAETDMENIAVSVNGGIDLPGRVIFDGLSANADPPRVIPEIQRSPFIFGMPPPQNLRSVPPNLRPDNSFVFQQIVPGDYRVFIRELGAATGRRTYIKAIHMGARDILRDGLHIQGQPEGELEIVIGLAVATVDGTILNGRGQPVPNATVVLLPYPIEPSADTFAEPFKVESSDVAGRFRINGVAPGEYIVLAWEDVDFNAWLDPDFIRTHESRGTRIRILEGAAENIRVTIP